MEFEQQLTESLTSAVRSVDAAPDLVGVERRADLARGRRRYAAGVVAAMLVVGAGGVGFGLGRAASGGEAASSPPATAPPSTSASGPAVTAAPPDDEVGDADVDLDVLDGAGRDEASVTTVGPAPDAADRVPGGANPRPYGAGDEAYFGPSWDRYELVLTRTTAAGYSVRALLGPRWDAEPYVAEAGVDGDSAGSTWEPANWCYPNRELRIGVSGPDLIDVGSVGWHDRRPGNTPFVAVAEIGWIDSAPIRVVAVHADPAAVHASVIYPDGGSDESSLTDGVAVLVVPGSDAWAGYEVRVTDGSGDVAVVTAASPWADADWRAACEPPPPELPLAGEQPADPGAEGAVRDVFARLFDRSTPVADREALVDDPTGVAAAFEAVADGPFADIAATAVHVLDELVFTSPTEAWFRYGIETSSGYFGSRFGQAFLIDGSWRIARDAVCQDLSLGGAQCVPAASPVELP